MPPHKYVMGETDKQETILRYEDRYCKYGYSPKTLGWPKGKQDLRFSILTSLYRFDGKRVLDIGCGFGDAFTVFQKKGSIAYWGCDLSESLIEEGRQRYAGANFICGDFLALEFEQQFDWAIASGLFNRKFEEMDNYDFIKNVMNKTFHSVKDGFSFDFISNKVDYKEDHLFYASPERLLGFAYKLSRNIVLRSDYMPFEFSLFIFKDDSFSTTDTIFQKYKNENF